MAIKESHRTKWTATGSLVKSSRMFHSGQRSKASSALKGSVPSFVVVKADGIISRTVTPPVKEPAKTHKFNRFSVQSIKRTLPTILLGKADRGYGTTCPVRVVRKTIHVGRPQYMGAGVWA